VGFGGGDAVPTENPDPAYANIGSGAIALPASLLLFIDHRRKHARWWVRNETDKATGGDCMHAIQVMIRSAYKTHTTLLVSTLITLITLKLIVLASPLLLGWAGAGALLAAVL